MRWCLLWTQSRSLSWWLQRQLSSNIGIRGNCIHRVALACLLLSWDRPCWVMVCGKRGRVLYSRHYGWEYVRFCGVGQLSAEIGGSMGISFFRVPECLTSTKFNLTGPLLLFKSKSNYNSKFKIDSKHCTIRHGHSFFLLFFGDRDLRNMRSFSQKSSSRIPYIHRRKWGRVARKRTTWNRGTAATAHPSRSFIKARWGKYNTYQVLYRVIIYSTQEGIILAGRK